MNIHKQFIALFIFVLGLFVSTFRASLSPQVAANTKPNIILIVVDTLRSDHISANGYLRSTTPNLDMWLADNGATFTNAIAPTPWTYPSNAGMLTGKQPANIGVTWSQWQQANNTIPETETMLAEYLKLESYTTAGFVSAFFVSDRFGFGQGFDVYRETIRDNANKVWAEELNASAIDWLNNEWQDTQPLFLFLYYYDPHSWYNPPAPYDLLYDSTYTGTLTADVYQTGRPVVEGTVVPTARDIEHIVALYDGSIAYWDYHFGEMMTYLEQNNILDSSIVILTSDHGEMFGEHDEWAHHNSVYEEVIRVPLLVRYDGVVQTNFVSDAPVSTIDITPTLLDFINSPTSDFDGFSLVDGLTGNITFPNNRPIFSEADAVIHPDIPPSWHAPKYELRAVREGNWKYIYGFSDTTQELYQLNADSIYETDNLFGTNFAKAQTMHATLAEWFFLPTDFSYFPGIQK